MSTFSLILLVTAGIESAVALWRRRTGDHRGAALAASMAIVLTVIALVTPLIINIT